MVACMAKTTVLASQYALVLSFVTCLFGVNRRNARFECFRALSLVPMLMLDGRKSRVELEI